MTILKSKVIFFFIFILAASFRLYGINWDSGQHLHPDERFLTMVAADISLSSNLKNYFDPQTSTLSPYNNDYPFFVYGTLPLNLVKTIAVLSNQDDYSQIHLLGRFISALFDLAVLFLVYLLSKKISNQKTALLSAFFYAIMVLPIQLSHFFAVDPFLNFFLFLTFYILIKQFLDRVSFANIIALSLSFALSLACKISAVYFSPIIALFFVIFLFKSRSKFFFLLLFPVFTLFLFRLFQPHVFINASWLNWLPNPQFVSNLKELQFYSDPESWFPPSVQWIATIPVIFPLKNIILWGLGLPLGLVFIFAFFKNCLNCRRLSFPLLSLHLWFLILLVYQGSQFSKTMRYFLPLYPVVAIIVALFVSKLKIQKSALLFLLLLIYPVSFMSIYSHPVTRLTASRWIYQNIPAGSTLATEHWDDSLPLNLPDLPSSLYSNQTLALYAPDTQEKWQTTNQQLLDSDYIILSSNRLYTSIPRSLNHYPRTSLYYQKLFDGSLGFSKVAEFASYPCFPPIGKAFFCINDDSAEEAFTVYDHPKVLIFKKNLFVPFD
jgi:hypothetical protein